MAKFLFSLIFLLFCTVTSAQNYYKGPWGPLSDPFLMSHDFIHEFVRLPLTGSAQSGRTYWSGGYWANKNGSINYRWNSSSPQGFDLVSPDKNQVASMSLQELAKLSPAEKYDLYTGRYDYPLKNQVEKIANRKAKSWEGICHGWAPASMNHPEPLPRNMRNPQGIEIPFGSSDIKALLSYYYAFGFEVPDTHQMGRRCNGGRIFNGSSDCREDLNAGSFHIALTNKIGIFKEGIVADMDRYKQIWNHPIVSYRSRILRDNLYPSRGAARQTQKEIEMETIISYINEAPDTWEAIGSTNLNLTETAKFSYRLEIDRWGNVVGGSWLSHERPDFLWIKPAPAYFTGTLSRLGDLLPRR